MTRNNFLEEINSHPRDSRIQFIEETHQYILDGGAYVFPRSVSGFVKKFFSHFDSKGVIKKNMKKWKSVDLEDTKVDEKIKKYKILFNAFKDCFPNSDENDECEFLCSVWKTNGERQSSLGTAMHFAIECFLNQPSLRSSDSESCTHDYSHDLKPLHQNPKTHGFVPLSSENNCPFKEDENVSKTVIRTNHLNDDGFCEKTNHLIQILKSPHFSLWEEDARALLLNTKLSSSIKLQNNNTTTHGRIKSFIDEENSFEMKAWRKWWETEKDDLVPFRTEWSVFSEKHDIAGQIDAVFRRKSKGDAFVLVDWKRVSEMDYGENKSNHPFLKFGKPPFQQIPDTNFGHYTLQINLYEMILERFYGIKIKERFLVQIHPSLSDPGYKVHPIKKI